jgi:hypothetical protein
MSSSTTVTNSVPVPGGATPDIWEGEQPSRVIHGASRAIIGRDDVLVGTTAIQFADGSVDDGSRVESPHVYGRRAPTADSLPLRPVSLRPRSSSAPTRLTGQEPDSSSALGNRLGRQVRVRQRGGDQVPESVED